MKEFLDRCRSYFYYVAFFSLFVNLLMLTLPIYMLQMFDKVIPSRSNETLLMLTLVAGFALMIMMLLEMLRARIMLGAGVAMDGLLGPPVLQGVLSNAARPGLNLSPAGLRDVAVLRGFLTGHGIFAMFDAPWVPFFIVLIFMFHPYLGWVAVVGALMLFGLGYINDKITREVFDEMSRGQKRAGGYIDSGVRNAEVVNALGMVGDLTQHWQKLNAEVLDAQAKVGRRSALISSTTRFLRMGIQITALAVGVMLVIDQHVTTGIMLASGLILGRALGPVEHAITTWKGLVDAMESYGNLKKLLEGEAPLEEGMDLPKPQGKLDVDRVIFSVPGNDRPILRGVSLSLAPGEALGLIGPSAAGKSTLARLITGIWRPTSGLIRLDGSDVSRWPRQQLGPHMGYLPQDVELFAGTVAQNIARLSEPDAEMVLAAAKRAQIHDMVLKLPHGYDTEIGMSGAVLSAGQRQRVALARALYGDPRLVVLDEPNANLDTDGEEALVRSMQNLRDDKVTVVIITHRPSLLGSVDKLLVLREGNVDGYGPRAEIMARIMPRAAAVSADGPQRITRGRI